MPPVAARPVEYDIEAAISRAPPSPRTSRSRSPRDIVLALTNPLEFDRIGEPVTCGVPLAKGFAAVAIREFWQNSRMRNIADETTL